MRSDLADVTVIVDRSGSMESIRTDAEGGVNSFISEQKKAPGECLFTLVQFDTEYEFVHKGVPVQGVPDYKLVPRGSTALMDAVGRSINEVGDRLGKMAEEQRPGLVIFVIVTDGQENASREFNTANVKEMIGRQEKDYNWKFTFLGAGPEAFAQGAAMGVSSNAQYSAQNVGAAYQAASSNVVRMRSAGASGQSLHSIHSSYTEEELNAMSDKA